MLRTAVTGSGSTQINSIDIHLPIFGIIRSRHSSWNHPIAMSAGARSGVSRYKLTLESHYDYDGGVG